MTDISLFIQAIFSSTGFKRLIASIISALIPVFAVYPQLQIVVSFLSWIASAVGVTALVHAGAANTLQISWVGTGVSILQIVAVALAQFPKTMPYAPIIQAIASALAAYSVPELAKLSFRGVLKDERK